MGCKAVVRQRDLQRITRLECNGTMGRRRRELHDWFGINPRATPAEAVRVLGYSYPDYMYAIADSVKVDLVRGDPRRWKAEEPDAISSRIRPAEEADRDRLLWPDSACKP
jgi:hypothetical protein